MPSFMQSQTLQQKQVPIDEIHWMIKQESEKILEAQVLAELRYDLPKTMSFHKKKSVDVEVDLWRFEVSDGSRAAALATRSFRRSAPASGDSDALSTFPTSLHSCASSPLSSLSGTHDSTRDDASSYSRAIAKRRSRHRLAAMDGDDNPPPAGWTANR